MVNFSFNATGFTEMKYIVGVSKYFFDERYCLFPLFFAAPKLSHPRKTLISFNQSRHIDYNCETRICCATRVIDIMLFEKSGQFCKNLR